MTEVRDASACLEELTKPPPSLGGALKDDLCVLRRSIQQTLHLEEDNTTLDCEDLEGWLCN